MLAHRDWRALRIGAATIGVLLVCAKGWPASRRLEASAREREAILLEHARAIGQEALATVEAARSVSEMTVEERDQLLAATFDAASDTELLADAARYVSGLADAVGVTVHSLDPVVDSTWQGPGTRILLTLHASSAGAELLRLVDELTAGPRLSVIEELTVQVRNAEVGNSERETLTTSVRVATLGSLRAGASP